MRLRVISSGLPILLLGGRLLLGAGCAHEPSLASEVSPPQRSVVPPVLDPTQGYPAQSYPAQGYPVQGYPAQGAPAPGAPTANNPTEEPFRTGDELRPAPVAPAPQAINKLEDSDTPPAAETLNDEKILKVAHVAHEEEIAKAKLAARRATDPRVRELARQIAREHELALERADRVARTSGITPTDSATSNWLRTKEQDQLVKIGAKRGAALDQAFLDSQVDSRSTMLRLIDDKMLPGASDSSVKSMVQATRPVIVNEMQKAMTLQMKMKE